ncbi:calpain-10 [Labeo rohita]|nr:calpain-10 [Labeo rohita]
METECEHHGMFVDPDFPADDSSLFCDYTTPLPKLLGDVTWLRPQVIPPEQPLWGDRIYRGEFRFQFWQNGHWIEVRVDDRLPCINDTLCFSRCQSSRAFWVALLEKAYAKLHGSYERLWAGQVCEAIVDLSGTIVVRWSLKGAESPQQPNDSKSEHTPNGLRLSELSLELKQRCAISCCVHSASTGVPELGQFHAMSVMEWTNVTTAAGEQVELIRIRNPWGRRSWAGVWRESGSGWASLEPSSAQDLLGRTAEGEFWMDETEFQQEFDEVTVGYPVSDAGHLQSIYTGSYLTHSHQIGGRWVKGHSAGGCRNNSTFSINPKFWLKVCERGEVLLSLLQYGHREPPAEGGTRQHSHLQAVALHVWKVEKKHFNLMRTLNKPPLVSHTHAYDREVVVHTHLNPGFYLLVPSTFLQGAEGRFLLRVHSSCSTSLSVMKSPPPLQHCSEGEWETTISHGCWSVGSTSGGSRNFPTHGHNPRIPLNVTYDPGSNNIKVTLRQNRPENSLYAIGFHIYKVPDGDSLLTPSSMSPVVSCVPHAHSQEVSVLCRLQPGEYIVIPSTYQPELSAHFTLTFTRRIHRKAMQSQELLGHVVQEAVVPGAGEHPLQYNYTFWYSRRTPGRPASTQSYEQNIKQIGSFASVEQFWRFYSHMIRPGDLTGHSDFHLFKEGIKPMWEDDANKSGGKWIIRLRKGLASRCWENLILAMLGEQFMVGEEICGAVVSVRFQEDIISIWNKTASDQATTARIRDTLRRVLNLPPNTIMEYKTHTDSIKAWEDFHGLVNASGGR